VLVRVLCLLSVTFALAGCPRDVQEPEPGEARPCERLEDCNGGRSCSEAPMRSCVDELCEAEPSLVLPCLPPPSTRLPLTDAG